LYKYFTLLFSSIVEIFHSTPPLTEDAILLCETWSLTLREEHGPRVFENRVLRGIFGPKRDEMIGNWRKLHNEELHNLYCSPSIIRMTKSWRIRWAWHVARMGGNTNAYRILVLTQEEKRPPGRPRHKWEDNIRMDLRGIRWGIN
jgi:hypothetical protein